VSAPVRLANSRPSRAGLTSPLVGALIVAVAPIAAAGALPAIVLIGAACDVTCAGHREAHPHTVAPVTPATVVINVSSIDIARDVTRHIPVDVDVAIDVTRYVSVYVDVAVDVARYVVVDIVLACR
jgi:hypothetical protein